MRTLADRKNTTAYWLGSICTFLGRHDGRKPRWKKSISTFSFSTGLVVCESSELKRLCAQISIGTRKEAKAADLSGQEMTCYIRAGADNFVHH